jgi:putative transposase
MLELDSNAHSVFLLHYHLVLVVKYRRPVFNDTISNRAKEIFEYIAPNYNITLEEWNHDKDHVHILFKAHPNTVYIPFHQSRLHAPSEPPCRLTRATFTEVESDVDECYAYQNEQLSRTS